ncbi:MAG: hypothetical protein K0S92_404 [Desertimonas sp.]|nr:hypothetical protein [Desertimonas sp.]
MHAPRWGRRRWLLIIALAAPVVGLLGVTIAELVPDGRIGSHLVNAMNRGEITAEDRTASLLGTTADHYAECVAVMNGLGDQPGTLVKRALYSSTSYGCVGTIETLERFGASGEFPRQPNYMRYWHGYSVFTRPALAIFGLSGTRWLAFATLGLSIVAFARSVFTRFGVVPMVVVIVPGLLTTDMIVGGWSIAQALGLASAWVGGWIVLTQASAERSWQVIAPAAALGGAINAYFDLMVAIPASLALCAVGAGLATLPAERRVDLAVMRSMAVAVCGWAVGLAAMWFAKWTFAWLFVDRQAIVDSVTDQISFRTSGAHDSVTGTRFNGFWRNVDFWLDRPLTPLVLAGTLVTIGVVTWRHRRLLQWPAPAWIAGALAIVAVPVIAWYMVLNNHNQIHFWLTYRSVAIAFGAVATVAIVAVTTYDDERPVARYAQRNGDDEAITSEPPEEQDVTPQAIPREGVAPQ